MKRIIQKRNLLGQVEYGDQFPAEALGELKAFGEHDNLRDQFVVGFGHRDGSEELLQVVRQLRSASVSFPGWVHGDENARVGVNINLEQQANRDENMPDESF